MGAGVNAARGGGGGGNECRVWRGWVYRGGRMSAGCGEGGCIGGGGAGGGFRVFEGTLVWEGIAVSVWMLLLISMLYFMLFLDSMHVEG